MKKILLYAIASGFLIVAAIQTLVSRLVSLPETFILFGWTAPRALLFVIPVLMLGTAGCLLIPVRKFPYPAGSVLASLAVEQVAALKVLWKEILFLAVFWMEFALLLGQKAVLGFADPSYAGTGLWNRTNAVFLVVLAVVFFFYYYAAVRKASVPVPSSGS
jgi:hypothetical protein